MAIVTTDSITGEKEMFDPHQINLPVRAIRQPPGLCQIKAGKEVEVQFMFQIRQRPGSYGIGQETAGATRHNITLDPTDELE